MSDKIAALFKQHILPMKPDPKDLEWEASLKWRNPTTLPSELDKSLIDGNVFRVKTLLNKGVKIEDDSYTTMLSMAAEYQHKDLILFLINSGVNINEEDGEALIWACFQGNLEIVKLLIDNGANIHSQDDEALSSAISGDHEDIAEYLLLKGANARAKDDALLVWAAENGNIALSRILLSYGSDPTAHNKQALSQAISYGHTEIEELLNHWISRYESIDIDPAIFNDLSLKELREPLQGSTENGLVLAARSGHFKKVINTALKNPSDPLTIRDLMMSDKKGSSVLDIIAAQNKLSDVFIPEIWINRKKELSYLWEHKVKPGHKKQIDIQSLLNKINRSALHHRARNIPKPPGL